MQAFKFAQRVFVKMTPKTQTSSVNDSRREALQIAINKFKINIDRTVFQKTTEERTLLKEMKASWKKSLAV